MNSDEMFNAIFAECIAVFNVDILLNNKFNRDYIEEKISSTINKRVAGVYVVIINRHNNNNLKYVENFQLKIGINGVFYSATYNNKEIRRDMYLGKLLDCE